MLVAGLAQMTPAAAQVQETGQDIARPPAAREVAVVESAPADDGFRPPARAVVAQAEPQVQGPSPAPEIDPADRDLAEAPPEEMRPAVIDPTTGRPMPARAVRGARPKMAHIVPQPKLADAVPAPAVAAVPAPVREEARMAPQPALAEADRAPRAARVAVAPVANTPEPQPVYAEEEHGDEANHVGQRSIARAPVYVAEEHGDEANHVGRPANDPAVYARAVRAAIPGALHADQAARQRVDDQEPAVAPVYARDDRPTPPVYAGEERDAGLVYAQDDRETPRGYDDRALEAGPRYAMQDPDVRPVLDREPQRGWQSGSRSADRGCADDRAGRLQARLLREAREGVIDRRTAQDIDDELSHVEELRQSYCASGMNAWREERLDTQYAQIEDRIRYEEDDRGFR